jgi:hypothetical protein
MNNAYEVLGTAHSHPSLSQVGRPRQQRVHGETRVVRGALAWWTQPPCLTSHRPHARFPKDTP